MSDFNFKDLFAKPDDNQYVSIAIAIVLILYAALAAPKLPENIASMFDNMWGKLILFSVIAFATFKSPLVGVIATIAVLVSLDTARRYDVNRKLVSILKHRQEMGQQEDGREGMDANIEYDEQDMSQGMPRNMHQRMRQGDMRQIGMPHGMIDDGTQYDGEVGRFAGQGSAFRHADNTCDNGEIEGIQEIRTVGESKLESEAELQEGASELRMNFRNNFYPQYVNMDPNTYNDRNNVRRVRGYTDPR